MLASFKLAAMIAAIGEGLGGGVETLREMYTPRFNFVDPYETHTGRRGKARRRAHNASVPYRYPHHNADKGCGAKQAAKYKRQISADTFNTPFDSRMRWNETVYPRVLEHRARQRGRL